MLYESVYIAKDHAFVDSAMCWSLTAIDSFRVYICIHFRYERESCQMKQMFSQPIPGGPAMDPFYSSPFSSYFRRQTPYFGQPDYRIYEMNKRLQQRTDVSYYFYFYIVIVEYSIFYLLVVTIYILHVELHSVFHRVRKSR